MILAEEILEETSKPEVQYLFPKGINTSINEEPVVCFNLDQYKTIGHIRVDYIWYSVNFIRLEHKILALETQVDNWKAKLGIQEERTSISERNAGFYKSLYVEEHKLMVSEQKFSRMKLMFPWSVLAVETVLFLGLSTYAYVHK